MANVAFPHRLVLNRFFLGLFQTDVYDLDIDPFRDAFKSFVEESLELHEDDGSSRFYLELVKRVPEGGYLTADKLLQYDDNIQRHTALINKKRTPKLNWKYFQYLSLLFTEIYLDWYFSNPDDLLQELNTHLDRFNGSLSEWGEKKKDLLPPFEMAGLKKLAFWNATGSGKTLLMHINILQYQHYVTKHRKEHELNRIVVLTPNEGLTHQHLDEFRQSNMSAAEFSKVANSGMFSGDVIDVIDMNKLREEGKKKTVSVDQFEQNNLVLIDEGHRGAKGDVWSEMRARLANEGFTFEYSATLGQAASSKPVLAGEYSKTILFDYSYRYFHADGFGKDYQILNLDVDEATEADKNNRQLYLTACLLSFYQQNLIYRERSSKHKAFFIDKPLWVFVGSKVTAIRKEAGKEISDVVDILLFIAEFVSNKAASVNNLERLISGNTGLLNQKNKDIFAESFPYISEASISAQDLFDQILDNIFNSPAGGALHVDYLKGGDGELALRVGGSEENFGVVNVGDAKKVADLCDKHDELEVSEKSFNSSIFKSINKKDSPINLLIGSKRFSEGWNSYRVSTLGLMYVGRSEGSEIIQLFGRGVRLRGYEYSLKRSRAIHWAAKDNDLSWIAKDDYLPILETLNVFGVKADYMAQFNAFLEGEGIKKPDDFVEKRIPVKLNLPRTPLITVKVPDDINFKKDKKSTLLAPEDFDSDSGAKLPHVTLDWYPRVAAKSSSGVRITRHDTDLDESNLEERHLAFLDYRAIYSSMQQLKAERNWYNLNLSNEAIKATLEDSTWYTLYVPNGRMAVDRFDKVFEWQEIAIALLKKYCDRFYKSEQEAYEAPFRKYAELDPSDPNFFEEYKLMIDQSEKLILQRISELQEHVKNGALSDFNIGGKGEALMFDKHLYSPLLHLKNGVDSDLFKISPTHLNKGENDFIHDLRDYYQGEPEILEGKEIYLLRNQSRGRGVGFFEAGNFYPDFILWILEGDKQKIIFIDPKGILRCEGINDPKLKFFETVKELEAKMRSKGIKYANKVEMHSFILSNTPLSKVRWWTEDLNTVDDFSKKNVLFQDEDKEGYLSKLFSIVLC